MSKRIVYVLTSGEYSSYTIEGVFSTHEKADAQGELLTWAGEASPIEIEEWELDEPLHPQKGLKVVMQEDGTVNDIRKVVISFPSETPRWEIFSIGREGGKVLLSNKVVTESKERAIKVTNELRGHLKALDLWHVGAEKRSCPKCGGTGLQGEVLCSLCKGHGKIIREGADE